MPLERDRSAVEDDDRCYALICQHLHALDRKVRVPRRRLALGQLLGARQRAAVQERVAVQGQRPSSQLTNVYLLLRGLELVVEARDAHRFMAGCASSRCFAVQRCSAANRVFWRSHAVICRSTARTQRARQQCTAAALSPRVEALCTRLRSLI